MVDNNIKFLDKNLMRLAIELVEWMELEMIELNKSAKFQGSIAEIKLFNAIRGEEKSISELARLMNISRQAVHKTAHKLEDLGFLELSTRHDNKKDRVVDSEKIQIMAKRLKNAKTIEFHKTEHEIFMEKNVYRNKMWTEIDSFLDINL